ncbi:MAG: protease Do [Candidatus Parvibacillus calidus]|nr:MAG: protease Do [Candidatus Parvibacillus calidus]
MYMIQPAGRPVSLSLSNGWSRFVNNEFAQGSGSNFIKAAKIGTPAVVRITVRNKAIPIWDIGSLVSSGSGVVITADGYIATNHHVLAPGNLYEVTFNDGHKFKATLTGSDQSTDIAVLKIDRDDCPYLTMANSDSVQVGQWVIAIGNPYQLNSTVTSGIVSAKGRTIDLLKGEYPLEYFIQTDAIFNEGNSGGALLNEEGELIGINTAIFTRSGKFEGYSFAIPSNIVRKMVGDIISYGKVQRAVLGVGIQDITDRLARRIGEPIGSGVYINKVNPDSPASEAGLRTGDIIISINGTNIRTYPALQEQVALYQPGDKVNIRYRRGGTIHIAEVELMPLKIESKKTVVRTDAPLKGIGLELRDDEGIPDPGIIVQDVIPGSSAARAGIKPGFKISEINGVVVTTIDQFINQLSKNQYRILLRGIEPESGLVTEYSIVKPVSGL